MSNPRTGMAIIPPAMEALLQLQPKRKALTLRLHTLVRTIGPDLTTLTASQVRGLVNAVAATNQRRTVAERRRSLAYYLAWRRQRARKKEDEAPSAQNALWATAADQVADAITELEQECKGAIDAVRKQQAGFWTQHEALLTTLEQQIIVQATEEFIHLLTRFIVSQQESSGALTSEKAEEGGIDAHN